MYSRLKSVGINSLAPWEAGVGGRVQLPAPYAGRLPKPVWVLAHESQAGLAAAVVAACAKGQSEAVQNGLPNEVTFLHRFLPLD